MSAVGPSAAVAPPDPLEDGDADLRHGEARGRGGESRVALLRVVDRGRRQGSDARGRPERRETASSAALVAISVVVVDASELAVEGVKVSGGEGGAEGGEALLEVGSVDLFFFIAFKRKKEKESRFCEVVKDEKETRRRVEFAQSLSPGLQASEK